MNIQLDLDRHGNGSLRAQVDLGASPERDGETETERHL